MEERRVEILAPAGSYESMTAAIEAGADAVYLGGSRFGARAYADNLNKEQMLEAINEVHLYGRRLYMTVNTLMKDKELEELYDYIEPFYQEGLDGVIVQDLGVLSFFKEYFPGLPLHASTQMTITGVNGARLLKSLGAQRIVAARELSLDEIRRIREQVGIEIECFVHGALCYCYSGQCLLSSMIGGRSGNRGRCAQPCRLPYQIKRDGKDIGKRDEPYVMSLKDLCTLDILPDIIEAGVYSLKIEGRMKSPRYTAGVVSVYRKYVDGYLKNGREGYHVEERDRRLLLELFDRGGFTEGYYRQHNGREMGAFWEKPGFRQVSQRLIEDLDERYVNHKTRIPVKGEAALKEGEPSALTLSCGSTKVIAYGAVAERARSQPFTEEMLLRQIRKTGNTRFVYRELSGIIEGQPFVPVQALNELRREGFRKLEEALLKPYRRGKGKRPSEEDMPFPPERRAYRSLSQNGEKMEISVSIERPGMAKVFAGMEHISRIYLDSNTIGRELWKELVKLCHDKGKECFLALPQIFRTEAEDYFTACKKEWAEAGFDGLLLRSLEEVEFIKKMDIHVPTVFDSCLYVWNQRASLVMRELGAEKITLPAELNERELERLGCAGRELIVYGYQPVMVSAQCMKKTSRGCDKKPELLSIRDRTGKEFPVRNHCRFCYNTFYNTAPLSLLKQKEDVLRLGPSSIRLMFTIETEQEAEEIAYAFIRRFMKEEEAAVPFQEFTKGHFKRGVE
ncbi:DUF3656 domain-containing protein [Lachnospiraceae bacterium 62-35]